MGAVLLLQCREGWRQTLPPCRQQGMVGNKGLPGEQAAPALPLGRAFWGTLSQQPIPWCSDNWAGSSGIVQMQTWYSSMSPNPVLHFAL